MMKRIILIAFSIILALYSCEKLSNSSNSSLLVLNGYLYQDEKIDSIYLVKSLPFSSTDTVYEPVEGAISSISWNSRKYVLTDIGKGYYSYEGSDLTVKIGETYSIDIEYNGTEITSSTKVPASTTIQPLINNIILIDTVRTFGPPQNGGSSSGDLQITWDNPDQSYFYVVIENADSTASSIVSGNSNFPGGGGGSNPGISRMRSQPFIGNSYTISSGVLTKYGKHIIKVYSVNQEYANLYENRTQDSRTLSEPVTNVTNGLGIFTAFSYAEATFYVKNKYRN
jgi:hypothetical protein